MAQTPLCDAHCHLDSVPQFQQCPTRLPDKTERIAYDRSFCQQTNREMLLVTSGFSHESNVSNSIFAEQYRNVYCCLGIAPQTAQQFSTESLQFSHWEDFIRKCKSPKMVAVGEAGLDYKWGKTDEERQRQAKCFSRMIALSFSLNLPLVVHSRDAESACLDTLEGEGVKRFMMHCFGGSEEEAKRAIDMGGIISIPPIRSKERKKIIKSAGIENLVVETDAPYIGKLPQDAWKSVEMIVESRGMGEGRAKEAVLENAMRFFSIKAGDILV